MDIAVTKSERETLKAIYRLTSGQGTGLSAHTGDLADRLGVTPGTMTSVVKRLADRGLVDYTPYRGVELTSGGRRTAVSVIRRHRIVERFLSDMLGYAWNEADRLAPSFEHELPQEVEDRLFVALHRPSTCPHGFPIPEPEVSDIPAMPSLYALEPGDTAVVAMSGATDQDMITFLDTLGVRPGVEVEVREKHPFDGPIVLRVDGHDRTIGERVAEQIFVRKTPRGAKQTAATAAGAAAGTDNDHRKEQAL
ncbi:MAG: DtxR family transcriptional regulator, Mn-dependent transcriptional regulator [Acidimicrobiaceae bacterium]|jgi:DtxR family Mn-dependent transcriptional regulator|nr:DtxR family transcriptional regulator, Mn-dependent transcriptional regulator [Acidimicrobiaceae bacterium]MDQ1398761.1 DtxR family transcriptional regulator, Mn-dependent transcriptional regulator [Acidimicrobiaceae bacterium]MDQ1412899.1 DtxR family transcriptional regulator, Mn-dependent transcriptional regulator [Acidimicrobiaceae bacterium]MDQ1417510.1 DtxR family transcriptional regulator, Mn-dependent transcriptional regulator [Acidimicrobiaceae bacterium]MDQ1421618.1 DtxR family tran